MFFIWCCTFFENKPSCNFGIHLKPPWINFGSNFANLGPKWTQLGPSWTHFQPTWDQLGHFWCHLGYYFGRLGSISALTGDVNTKPCSCKHELGHSGTNLGPTWCHLVPMCALADQFGTNLRCIIGDVIALLCIALHLHSTSFTHIGDPGVRASLCITLHCLVFCMHGIALHVPDRRHRP